MSAKAIIITFTRLFIILALIYMFTKSSFLLWMIGFLVLAYIVYNILRVYKK